MKRNTLYYGVLKSLKTKPMSVIEIAKTIGSKPEYVIREIRRIQQSGLFAKWIVFLPVEQRYVFVKELQKMPINKIDWLVKQMKPQNFNSYMDLKEPPRITNTSLEDYKALNKMIKSVEEN